MSGRQKRFSWVLVSALVLLAVSPASAQRMGRGGFGGASYQPDFLRRDVLLFVEGLQLGQDQAVIFEMVYDDYERSTQSAISEFRERQDALRPQQEISAEDRAKRDRLQGELEQLQRQADQLESSGGDVSQIRQLVEERSRSLRGELREFRPARMNEEERNAYMSGLARLTREWQGRRRGLRDEFVMNMLATLADWQLDLWPPLEREIRRSHTIGRGELSGESVDLFLLVRDLQLDAVQAGEIDPLLQAYDLELDAALVRRDEVIDGSQADLSLAFTEGEMDKAIRMIEQQMALRRTVRSVNDNYAELVAATLGEEAPAAAELTEAFRLRGYGRVFRETRAQRAFDAALELEGLEQDIIDSINALYAGYLAELRAMNEQLLALVRREEPKQRTARMEWMAARRAGQDVERAADPLREAFDRRDEIDDRYLEQLQALLTPEQYEELDVPERRRGRGDRGGMGGGRGDGGGRFGDMTEEERAQRRAEFLDRFDSNGDGEIDADEREAIRDAFRRGDMEGFGRGFGGRGGRGGGGGGRGGGGGGRGGGGD